MRIISWNCRGLGNCSAVRGLLDVQKREDSDILFRSEIKHDSKWIEWFRWRLEMPNMVAKSSTCTSGGLALFWRNGVDVNVKSMSKYHIDAIIKEVDGGRWRFTGIYGESKTEEKENTWACLGC